MWVWKIKTKKKSDNYICNSFTLIQTMLPNLFSGGGGLPLGECGPQTLRDPRHGVHRDDRTTMLPPMGRRRRRGRLRTRMIQPLRVDTDARRRRRAAQEEATLRTGSEWRPAPERTRATVRGVAWCSGGERPFGGSDGFGRAKFGCVDGRGQAPITDVEREFWSRCLGRGRLGVGAGRSVSGIGQILRL